MRGVELTDEQQAALDRASARMAEEGEGSQSQSATAPAVEDRPASNGLNSAQQAAIDRAGARIESGEMPPSGSSSEGLDRSNLRAVGDTATSLVAGVPKALGALASLGSLVPGVNYVADPVAQGLYGAGEWVEDQLHSDYQAAKDEELAARISKAADSVGDLPEDATNRDRAQHIYDMVVAQGGEAGSHVWDNPTQAFNMIAATVPHIFLGGFAAKGVKGVSAVAGVNVGARTSGAIGEGLIAAGDATGTIVGEDYEGLGTAYGANRLAGLAAGAGTALVGRGMAGKFDVDTVVAGGSRDLLSEAGAAGRKSVIAQAGLAAGREGAEELIQSGQEQVFTNLGTGDPLYENVGSSAVLGAVAGAGLGAGMGGAGQVMANATPAGGPPPNSVEAQEDAALEAQHANENQAAIDEQAQALAEKQAAGLQNQQDADNLASARREAAQTFTPRSEFAAARESAVAERLDAEVRNPETDAGKNFVAHLNQNHIYDPADVEAEVSSFVKGYLDETKDSTAAWVESEYVAALDQYAAGLARGEPPMAPMAPTVEQAPAAETTATPAPTKATPAPTDTSAPATLTQKQTQMAALAEEKLGPDWRVENPELLTQLTTPGFVQSRGANKPTKFETQINRIVRESGAPVEPLAETAETAPAKPKKLNKLETARQYAVERLGEDFEVNHPELSGSLHDGKSIYNKAKGKRPRFEVLVDRAVEENAAEQAAEEQAVLDAANPPPAKSVFDGDSDVSTGMKPQQQKVIQALKDAEENSALGDLVSVMFKSGDTTTEADDPKADSSFKARRNARRKYLKDAGVPADVIEKVFEEKVTTLTTKQQLKYPGSKTRKQPKLLQEQKKTLRAAGVSEYVVSGFEAVRVEAKTSKPKERGYEVVFNNAELQRLSGIENARSAATATSAVVSKLREVYGNEGLREKLLMAGVSMDSGVQIADTQTANDLLGAGGSAQGTVSSAGGTEVEGASSKQKAAAKAKEAKALKKDGMTDADVKAFQDGPVQTTGKTTEELVAEQRADEEAAVEAMSGLLAQSWDTGKSFNGPSFADLTIDQKIDWMHYYRESETSVASDRFDVLDKRQREIERLADGREIQTDEGGEPKVQARDGVESDPIAAGLARSGDRVETVRTPDTGSLRSGASKEEQVETGVTGAAKAPTVETKKRKKLVKKPADKTVAADTAKRGKIGVPTQEAVSPETVNELPPAPEPANEPAEEAEAIGSPNGRTARLFAAPEELRNQISFKESYAQREGLTRGLFENPDLADVAEFAHWLGSLTDAQWDQINPHFTSERNPFKNAGFFDVEGSREMLEKHLSAPGAKFSTTDAAAEAAVQETKSHEDTASAVQEAIKWLVGDNASWRTETLKSPDDLIGMVLSKKLDVDGSVVGDVLEQPNASAVVVTDNDGVTRAFFFTDNIAPGTERGVVIHELGGHLGMDNVLTRDQLEAAVGKIQGWADGPDKGVEKGIAQRAVARLESAQEQGAVGDANSELLAYFLEEAVNAGITPTSDTKSDLTSFIRKIWADFKAALRKLRPANEAALTAQDLVNMARGAARLELATDFHGATEAFRKTNPDYFGLGNNAVGVGFYVAEDFVEGAKYMTQRMNERESNDGVLQRIDTSVAENEYVDWDTPLAEQPAMLETFERLPKDIQDALLKDSRIDRIEKLTGRQFYLGLTQLQLRDKSLQEYISPAALDRSNRLERGVNKAMSVASAFLDVNGIKGIKTKVKEETSNPNRMFNKIIFNDKNIVVVGRNDVADVNPNSTEPGTVKFSTPENNQVQQSEVNKQVAWARKNLGNSAGEALTNLGVAAKAPLTATKNLDRVIRDNASKLPSARKWFDKMLAAEATKNRILGAVDNVVNQIRQFKPERREVINKFLSQSTFHQKWGYDPRWADSKGKLIKVKIDPIMKQKFNRLSAEEQQAVRDVFNHGRKMQLEMYEVAEALGVSKFFKLDSKLKGPYAPLKRFGDYVGELKSQALLDAQAAVAEDPSDKNRKEVAKLKESSDHYVVSFFDSLGAAQSFTEANKTKFAYAVADEKRVDFEESRAGGAKAFEKIMGAVNANLANLDPKSKEAMAAVVRDMYFQTLDESNARLSGVRRLNRAGFDSNMLRSFAANGVAQANLVAQLRHGADINLALIETSKEAAATNSTNVYNQIAMKYRAMMTPRKGMVQKVEDAVLKFNSTYMLTSSLGYMIQNGTQPYFAVANIGEIGGYSTQPAVWGRLFGGYKVARKVINTGFLNQVKNVGSFGALGGNSTVELNLDNAPADLRPLLRQLQSRGLLDVGITEDLRSVGTEGNNALTRGYEEMTHRLYQSARFVEANNRIASAVAAYRTALKQPKMMRKLGLTPQEYAIRIVQDTQGNFSKLDAPAAFDVLPKLPLQFRKYQFFMAWLHVDAAKQTFKGADAGMKMAGFRKLSLMMGYTSIFGGLASVPFSGPVTMLAQALLGSEDEDELNPKKTLERWLRENVDDERTATLLSRGLPAALGWDFSQKLDQSTLFSAYNSRYVSLDTSRPDGVVAFAGKLAFGPTAAMMGSANNALDFWNRGDLYRATESVMPKGLRSYMETYRYSADGYTKRNGLTIQDARSFDFVDFLTNAVGLPSTDINQIKWTNGQRVEIEKWVSDEGTRIRRGYLAAHEDGNRSSMDRYKGEFRELQAAKNRLRPFFNDAPHALKRSSIMTLLRAPRNQRSEQRRLDRVTGN